MMRAGRYGAVPIASRPHSVVLTGSPARSLQVLVLNGLDKSKFIHLDFLDFAMSVMKLDVNPGNLHAIHDGLDCTTFTDMANSTSERDISNAFFGASKEAYATNLR